MTDIFTVYILCPGNTVCCLAIQASRLVMVSLYTLAHFIIIRIVSCLNAYHSSVENHWLVNSALYHVPLCHFLVTLT